MVTNWFPARARFCTSQSRLSPQGQHVQPGHRQIRLPKQVLGRSGSDQPAKLLHQSGIEIRLDAQGKGVGKMAVATKIEFDKAKKQMVLENYSSEPVRLNEVKIQK